MLSDSVVVVSYARTLMGRFQGVFASVKATDPGATAMPAAVAWAGIALETI